MVDGKPPLKITQPALLNAELMQSPRARNCGIFMLTMSMLLAPQSVLMLLTFWLEVRVGRTVTAFQWTVVALLPLIMSFFVLGIGFGAAVIERRSRRSITLAAKWVRLAPGNAIRTNRVDRVTLVRKHGRDWRELTIHYREGKRVRRWNMLVGDEPAADDLARALDPLSEAHSRTAQEQADLPVASPAPAPAHGRLWAEYLLALLLPAAVGFGPFFLLLKYPDHPVIQPALQFLRSLFRGSDAQREIVKGLLKIYSLLLLVGSMYWIGSIVRRMKFAPIKL
jgi:hypothetical protein